MIVGEMRLIFSRKGFDTASGGCPSPIFPDGRMLSIPIPDKQSPICYGDIRWHENNLGLVVHDMTKGRIPATYRAHLDPDLRRESLTRSDYWLPLLGQTGTAQGHLRMNGVEAGDLFLFFGLFRRVVLSRSKLGWNLSSRPVHVLWGWLQVEEIVSVDSCDLNEYRWATYHPHFHRKPEKNNTLYVGRKVLNLPYGSTTPRDGAGVFERFSPKLQLTSPSGSNPSLWSLPNWIYPDVGKQPMSYHGDMARWRKNGQTTLLETVGRGQEFVLNCEHYPEAIQWANELLMS